MTDRVAKLRKISLDTQTSITPERALLMTEFYKQANTLTLSPPMLRAMAFRFLMENKAVNILEGELIVGERGPGPRVTPTFPEVCCHTPEELDILNSRDKVAYSVSDETKKHYEETVIPFWRGRTLRDRVFAEMTDEWIKTYQAGIFTEFMEQRAPGHTALDGRIYSRGMLEIKEEIRKELDDLNYKEDPHAYARQEQLKAMDVCADALINFGRRYAEKARELSEKEKDPRRKKELINISEICAHVPANTPRNMWEALQMYWFVHIGVISELNTWDAISPGRLDQHLYPFYKRDLETGTLTPEYARELLQCFFIKFNNQPAPPKVGVTAQESGTYNDFALISLGGQTSRGEDGVNDLSYVLLDVLEEMRLVQPHVCIQLSQKNPDRFLRRGCEVIRTGFGQPSVFNHDAVVQELVRAGKSLTDAREGGTSGCVETGAFGKENYNLTGYFNLVKVLEVTLNNGKDPRTGEQIGIETGDPVLFKDYQELLNAFEKQVNHFVDMKVRGNCVIERLYAAYMPAPFLSLLISDCIQTGRDYHDGGPRYNTSYIQGVGLGSITDILASIRYNVYDRKHVAMKELLEALRVNFRGREPLLQRFLKKTPKFGNDNDYADSIMKQIFEIFFRAVEGRPNTKGGEYHINLLPTTVHVYFGSVVGATADGRLEEQPLSEGVSPVQGSDQHGPTAVIKSVGKIDHLRTGGTLLNQKFSPQILEGEKGIVKLAHLIRSYFRMNGHHVQFNVIRVETLRAAQKEPDKYRNLIVRVAGYSDYFCNLSKGLQEEIIARTEHQTL
jgi:formate C-acetyltransferase